MGSAAAIMIVMTVAVTQTMTRHDGGTRAAAVATLRRGERQTRRHTVRDEPSRLGRCRERRGSFIQARKAAVSMAENGSRSAAPLVKPLRTRCSVHSS